MSSFRIDRQYVTFVTAETQPVHVHIEPENEPEPLGNGLDSRDISELYNEIYERLQNEHAEQAEYMLTRAAKEADETVLKARQQADEILAQAQAEAEAFRQDVRTKLEAEAAKQKLEEEKRKLEKEKQLTELENNLKNAYSELVNGAHGEIVKLVMEITRKIINIKLSKSDEVFMGLVKDALERLKHTGSVIIRISPEEYARFFGSDRSQPVLEAGDIKLGVVEDPSFSVGDLVVESEGEMIDLSIGRQLEQIEKAFMN